MVTNPPLRRLLLPPKGRPHWLSVQESAFDLGYLSWGYRWYGESPIEPSLHEGWHYFVVLEGGPVLLVSGRKVRTGPGRVCIAHPDCPVGHRDEPGRRCRMLTWIWRTAPAHSALRPPPGGFLRLRLTRDQLRRLERLHAVCVQAVALASERSILELRAARLDLDLCLLEARERRWAADNDFRFDLAVEYLRHHLDERQPVERLCEYLRVSPASLKRLFHDRAGRSPRAFALGWRMKWARERLASGGASVKAVAYALGYRHPNDFSRAFRRHEGIPPSRVSNRRVQG